MSSENREKGKPKKALSREERVAASLRENLLRRKEQERARSGNQTDGAREN